MIIIDLKRDYSRENKYFSNTLLNKIQETLDKKKKIILYLNKRGDYSSYLCKKCSYLFKCQNCDISMNIHENDLVCHICNSRINLPLKCYKCKSTELQKIGIGTSQIEKYIKNKFIDKKIYRFDTDKVKNKKEKNEALNSLINSDIIIGTKMITTGFDLENIGLVGIILLEQELQIAKYNTSEKLFSNLKQFLGRGGRRGEKTEVLIQSFIPENDIIKNILYSNYKEFFKFTLNERKDFNYPPYCEFVTIEYKNKSMENSILFMTNLKNKLDNLNNDAKVEIIFNPISIKRNNQFYSKILLKGKNIKTFLSNIKKEIFSNSNLAIFFD